MTLRSLALASMFLTTVAAGGTAANATVMAGPALGLSSAGWNFSGLRFQANADVSLTAFTFQNRGKADTILLTDLGGTILHSLATPALTTSYVANVNWALTSGNSYWLLQSVESNAKFAVFNAPLPSNADITITQSGNFGDSLAEVLFYDRGGANGFWFSFNDITTDVVPEPSSWVMMIAGFGLVGGAMRRRAPAAA